MREIISKNINSNRHASSISSEGIMIDPPKPYNLLYNFGLNLSLINI